MAGSSGRAAWDDSGHQIRIAEDGNLLDNFDVEPLERGDVGGGVGEQSNFVNAEVSENLPAKPDLAQDALVLTVIFLRACFPLFSGGGGFAVEEDAMRFNAAINVESTAGVVKINQRAAAGFGNLAERLLNEVMAIAG